MEIIFGDASLEKYDGAIFKFVYLFRGSFQTAVEYESANSVQDGRLLSARTTQHLGRSFSKVNFKFVCKICIDVAYNDFCISNGSADGWEDTANKIFQWGAFLETFHSDAVREIVQDSVDVSPKTWRFEFV
jgi:hypothetical protein